MRIFPHKYDDTNYRQLPALNLIHHEYCINNRGHLVDFHRKVCTTQAKWYDAQHRRHTEWNDIIFDVSVLKSSSVPLLSLPQGS